MDLAGLKPSQLPNCSQNSSFPISIDFVQPDPGLWQWRYPTNDGYGPLWEASGTADLVQWYMDTILRHTVL